MSTQVDPPRSGRYNRFVRTILVAAALLLIAGSVAMAAPRTAGNQSACEDTKAVDIYFWPHGHQAVPGFSSSAYTVPHVEVYRAKSVSNQNLIGFADTKNGSLSSGCRVVDEIPARWGGGKRRIVKVKARVRCTFKQSIELKATQLPSGLGWRLSVMPGHTGRIFVDLSLNPNASQLTYAKRQCKRLKLLPGS
jgi:hypothetical protein